MTGSEPFDFPRLKELVTKVGLWAE